MKGEEAFAGRTRQEAGESRLIRRNLTVKAVAREVARSQAISPEKMMSLGQGRVGSRARVLTAWVAREVAGISIRRDTSTDGKERIEVGGAKAHRQAPAQPLTIL